MSLCRHSRKIPLLHGQGSTQVFAQSASAPLHLVPYPPLRLLIHLASEETQLNSNPPRRSYLGTDATGWFSQCCSVFFL
jgi:hypothetical protein